jgi:PKD repeat protein
MALFKKTVKKQNLDQVQVFIEDTENKYFKILDSPGIIPTGRSSILIDGSPALKRETDILFELVDISGKVVYINPIRNYLEGTSRRLSIEVYEDVTPGIATLTLLGEINPDPEQNDGLVIPEEFQDVYNVRYQTEIMIDPSSPNNEKILFLRAPKLSISETVLQEVIPKTGQKEVNVLVSGSLSGERIPANVQQFLNPNLIAHSDLELRFTDNTKPTGVLRNNKFDVNLIADAVGPINNVEFDWGDSTTDDFNPQTANGSHTYTKAQTYTIRATGNSPFGGGAKDEVEVTVSPPATPKAGMFVSNGVLNEAQSGEAQYLTGSLETSTNPLFTKARFRFTDRSIYSASADDASNPDDNIDDTTFQWDFGDGRSLVVTGSAGKRVIHEYSESGDYTVTHTVGNNYNTQTNSTAQTVKVHPTAAVADFSQSNSVVNTDVNFNVTSSATIGTGLDIDKFHWYFENGQITGSQFINYAPNNIFGSALSGFWSGYSVGNTSVTRQSSVAYSGSNAIAQVSNAADSYFGHYRGSSTAALAPATQSDGFTVSAYAKAASDNTFAYLSLYGLDANYETIGEEGDANQNIVVGDLTQLNSSGWTKLSVHSRFLHPGTKYASFRVGAKNSSGKTIYWDGFKLFPTSVTGSAVSASYSVGGNFDIEHYVVDETGRKSNTVIKQSVSNAVTPRPHVTSNVTSGTAPLTVTFTEDGEGSPTSQKLFTGVSEVEMSASGQTTAATYTSQGTFKPRIVSNWSGGTKEFVGQPITVANAVPRITSISGSTAVTASQSFTLIVSASSNTPSEKYIDEMSIAWGDTTSDLIYFQAGVPTGLEFNGVDASHISLTHAYAAAGAYTASAVAKDTNGKSSTSSSLYVDVVSGQVPVVADTDIMIDDLETVNEPTASLSFGSHNLTTRINSSYFASTGIKLTSYTWSLHDESYDEITVLGNGNRSSFVVDDVDFKAIGLTVGAPGVSSNTAYYNITCIDTESESQKANANTGEDDAYDDQQHSEAQTNNGGTGGGGGGGSSYSDGNYDSNASGRNDSYMTAASPEVQNYKVSLDSISDSREVGEYLNGAKIKVDRFELYEFAQKHQYPVSKLISQNLPYEFTVSDIKGTDVIPSSRPLTFNNSVDSLAYKLLEIPDLGSSPYTMSFNETVEFDYNEINYISKSTFKLSNLRTLSGDVYRAKIYYRTVNDTEFIPLTERILESREEMIDDLSLKGNLMKGYFPTRSIVDTYWTGSQGTNAGYYSGAVAGSGPVGGFDRATISHIHDAVVISGSNYSENDNVAFWLNSSRTKNIAGKGNIVGENRPLIMRDMEYSLSFNAYPIKAPKQVRINENLVDQDKAELKVYVSGSGVKPKKIGSEFKSTPWGYFIGSIDPDDEGVDANITFPKMVYQNFVLESTARPIIQFIASSGKWYVSSISLKQARESGFNPNNAIITTDTPALSQRPQRLLFKVEYFTKDGKQAQMETFSANAEQFAGSNTVFSGTDNILPGTLTINNSLGEGQGFELSGQSSAYFRTKSYEGFKRATTGEGPSGILMFSGSVGTAISASEDYDGLGLELHAGGDEGSLKFRTNPSVFEVKAKSFFLGSDEQYVSGSGGNIEISSSNFHLSSSGDVVVKGNIEAQTGKIGGFNIGREKLSGDTFYIRGNADENSTTDSGLFISASNFQVKADGHISGTAGNIGGWGIEQNSLGSSNIILSSTGSIRTRDYAKKASGWTIDSDGFAEFSNVFVRGTLATTTFEKQTVNAVGGQLLVSNATTISGSVTDSATTLPLVNSAGFQPGELLFVKKVGDTGFSSEFMRLTAAYSASDQTGNSTGFINAITVTRELQGSVTGSIGNFGGAASVSASYDDGQVIISFGRPQTGFIHINADPTDTETPYIDVIESGSGGFLRRARFGDLSGLASTAAVHNESSPGFGLAAENVFLSGSIRANEGYIGSWNILNNGLISGSNITLDADSSRIYKTGDNSETEGYYLDFTPGTNYYVRFGTDFAVSSSGQLIASGAKIEGVLTSSLGLIGGWTIGSDTLTGGAAELNSDGNLTLGSSNNVVRLSADDGTYRIWAGNATAGSAPFRVTKAGVLTATGATITGNIDITSGDLAGIDAAAISGSAVSGSTANANRAASAQSAADSGSSQIDTLQTRVTIKSTGMQLKDQSANVLSDYGVTSKIFERGTTNTFIEVGGKGITIVSGSVTGSAFTNATSSIYGSSDKHERVEVVGTGFKIYENNKQMANVGASGLDVYDTSNNRIARFAATTTIGDTSGEHISIDNNSIDIKTSANVTVMSASADGIEMSGSIKAGSGEIGGWTIGSSTLTGGVVTLNSAGSIEVGSLANATTTATTNSGFFADASGNVLIKGNVSGNDYLKISAGGGIDIKSQTFDLDAGTLALDSTTNSGTVMVGSATAQRLVMSGSSGELAFYNSDGDQRMRLLTRTEQTSYIRANGSAIITSEKAAIQDMTAGRLSINGAIQEQWDDVYTTSSIEGGKLYMNARQNDALSYSGTSQKLAEFHLSGSIISTSGGATTAVTASSINTGYGFASGITVGSVYSALTATGVKVSGVTSTGALAASFYSEGVSGAAGSNRTIALYATENGGNIIIGSGSASEPAYGFASDRDTGIFMQSAGNIGVSLAGTEEFRFAAGGHFHADNDITAYSSTVSSDIRLKENIKPLENNLDKILELKPSSFTWKVRDKQDDVGLIAQDVEPIIPMIVQDTISIGGTKEFLDGDTHKVVDYAKLTTYLIGAIQEQQKQIDELKKKLEVT